MLHYSSHEQPHLRMLSEEQILDIHLATLEILARTGVEVREARARELLKQAGARVEGERVWIPSPLVEEAVRTAPERVVMAKRTGERSMPLEANRVFFGTGSDTPNTIDPDTRQRRRSRAADVGRFARLCDALPEIDFIMSLGVAGDVPEKAPFVYEFVEMLRGSSKPIVYTAHDLEDMEDIYELAVTVAGGQAALHTNPFLMHYAEPITPLIHSPVGLRKLLFCADHHIPIVYASGMSAGGSGPVTLAGSIALSSAECLSGLVIHQLASPGAPFIYGATTSVVDMGTLSYVYGGPEMSVANAAYADLARYYRLPVWGLAGSSDAMQVDAQAGLEAMLSVLMAFLSRGNLVHDVGYVESGLTSSMEMVTMCNEIIGMVRVLGRGVVTDADHLALEVIEEVGIGSHFLPTEHTARHFRTEHFLPRLLNRYNFAGWQQRGGKSLEDRTNERVREILAGHTPAPLSDAAEALAATVLQRAAARS